MTGVQTCALPICQILLEQNYRSVNFRYEEDESAPNFVAMLVRQCSPVEIIKLCDCYNYQSCETEDWDQTQAYAISQALRERAISMLPGMSEASWTFKN